MPQTAILYYELEKNGITLDKVPLTISEAINSIKNLKNFPINKKSINSDKTSNELLINNQSVLKIDNLSFSYDKYKVLNSISLNIDSGDFLAIVGTNGAGKTTLAKHMVNIIEPPKNKVFIDNNDISKISSKKLSKKIGYVFQNPEHQFIKDTIDEQLSFGLKLRGFSDNQIDDWLNKTLKQFDIENYRNKPLYVKPWSKTIVKRCNNVNFGTRYFNIR